MTPRIPPLSADELEPRTAEMIDALRRPDGAVLNIFTTLAHHPKLMNKWLGFGGALLYGGRLSGRERELLIMRTAWHCHAHYEWGQHVGFAHAAGLTDDDIARITTGPDDAGWSDDDRVLLRAADELHRDARIGDTTWAELVTRYDEQQLIEVCMVVGQYHLVAFTLNSLGVESEAGLPEMPARGES